MGKLFDDAIKFAVDAHAGMCRKGTDIPYIVHPMEVSSIVSSMTSKDEVLAAAVLHDTVEDTFVTLEMIRERFGERVCGLVAGESENKREDISKSESWKIRKQETINELCRTDDIEQKMITLGDKLSNMRSIYADYRKIGDALFERFNQKEKSEHAWYYRSICDALECLSDTLAYKELDRLINAVFSDS
mgnify:CR=1 FL=1